MTEYVSPTHVLSDVSVLENANGRPFDCAGRRVAGAISVLGRLFGPEWLDSRIVSGAAEGRAFIRPAGTEPFNQFKMGDRIVTLAEHLVNLQEIDGFGFCLEELRTDKIEPNFAKLVAAGMLRTRSIPFRFVVPSHRLGRDYDAEAIIGAAVVPVEMKAKVEGRALSAKSIRHSLRRARKQLPKGTPNLVFLRVPESWALTEAGRTEITTAILEEFTDSGSIGVVVVHYERWYTPPERLGAGQRRHRLLIVSNGRAHVDLAALEDELSAIPENREEVPWLTFERLLCADTAPSASGRRDSPPEPNVSSLPDITDLTLLGPVELQYAHFCEKAIRSPTGVTWQRIRQHIQLEPGMEGLPSKSDLVVGLVGRRRFKEGKRTLRVLFAKDDNGGSGIFHEQDIDFSRVGGTNGPVIARHTLDVGLLKIDGAGIYNFDFLLENQFVGRLPLVIFSDQIPTGRVDRGPLRTRPVDLEFGHVVQAVDPPKSGDPEGGFTLQGVGDGFSIPESSPFRLPALALIIGLSAPGSSAATHAISVQCRDGQGNSLSGPAEVTTLFQPFLPGVLSAVGVLPLDRLVFPGTGLYEFHVSVDGNLVGQVKFPVSVVPDG